MKKRGERKGTVRSKVKKDRSAGSSGKTAAEAGTVHARHSHAKSEPTLLQKEEQLVKSEFRFLLSPQEFHVVTFVASLIVLAFLFNSTGMIFYSVLAIAALIFAHFLRQHHRPHDVITILGVFFLPLAFTLMAFRDVFTIVLTGVYLVSGISTVILYFYHKKEHTPLKIMWQVTYSRIIAITLGVVVAAILPSLVLPDAFLSIPELLFLYILPVSFVFFFASKFFYLYFFDRKHIRLDLMRSLKHTLIYTLGFLVIFICIYSLFAVNFYNTKMGEYSDNLDNSLLLVSNLDKDLMRLPEDVSRMMVTKDLESFTGQVLMDVAAQRTAVDRQSMSFGDVLDDSYFSVLSGNVVDTVRMVIMQQELLALRQGILERYDEFSGDEWKLFTSSLDAYSKELEVFIDDNYVAFAQDDTVSEVMQALDDPSVPPSYFETEGVFYWFAQETQLSFVYGSKSIFGKQLSAVARKSVVFREFTGIVVRIMVLVSKESSSPAAIEHIYANMDADIIPMSKVIRRSIISDSLKFRQKNLEQASRVSFKVE
ncbi:MAG: hypothetical protein V1729_03640 [Candidatus Woesearchaeota archaeon]